MPETVPTDWPDADETAIDEVRVFAGQLTKLVEVARALVDADRAIDLTGLDSEVGLLCAKTLDLPPADGRRMRPRLIALFGSMEELSRAIAARRGPPSH